LQPIDLFLLNNSNSHANAKMTDAMPLPAPRTPIPRNDSFSAEDLTKALKAAVNKPRDFLNVQQDILAVPPPSPNYTKFATPSWK
jgi:hypothetical protein